MIYYIKSFGVGALSKVLNALIQFFTVPLLILQFGEGNFGLISMGLAINAYMALLDLGINIGAIKFFSEWLQKKDLVKINSVARSSISFYFGIGIINTILLIIVAYFSDSIFNLELEQKEIFKTLIYVISFFTIFNWVSSVFRQVITAYEKIYLLHITDLIKNILQLVLVLLVPILKLSIGTYFFIFSFLNALVLLPLILITYKNKLISSVLPSLNFEYFWPIMRYGLAILAIGIFSFTASKFRPIILGIFSEPSMSTKNVADYRIMETITLFITSIGGLLLPIFLPKTSQLLLKNNKDELNKFAIEGTLYTSIISCILCFPIILNSKSILTLYVGTNYIYLDNYLSIWVLTILLYLHNTPVASLVLSSGKTKALVISTALASVLSILVNIILSKSLGAGSAVIGYAVYIIIQMLFYYLFFNTRVLHLKSISIFLSFFKPLLMGALSFFLVKSIELLKLQLILDILQKSILWTTLFLLLLFLSRILRFSDIRQFVKRA